MAHAAPSPNPTLGRPARSAEPLAGMKRARVVLRGLAEAPVEADVAEVGQGRPFLFLHGLVGLNDHWEDVVRRLHPRSRCVMLELPLLGLRDEDCSIDGATELTVRFIREYFAASPRPIVVGNSFGGHVALKIALGRPELIGGLVLAGASGLIEKSMVSDIQIKPSRAWMERKIGELFFDQSKMNPADVDRAYRELTDRGKARAMVRLSRTARRNHLGDEIHRIGTPTLVIWGRQDVVTPPEAADEFLSKIRGSRIVWLENCGHAPMIEHPEPFADALLSFAQTLPS